jgi:hypothetical protein
MPWQRHVVDVALEIDEATGLLAYREVVLTVPRQSGKSTLLGALLAWRCAFWPNQRVAFTAQTAQDARTKWRDEFVPMLERSSLAGMYVVRQSNGSEGLRWKNGSIQSIVATTEKAGHGLSLDMALVDEFFAASDSRLEQSLKPATITREQPQMWFVSTAGTSSSGPLRAKVERGRENVSAGRTDGMAYFEWSAPGEGVEDLDELLLSCHPAVGHTISLANLRADFESMEPAEAERAYLNRWTAQVTQAPIPVSTWNRRSSDSMTLGDDLVFAVDFTPDRASASIAAAGLCDEERHGVELVEHREGTEWVVSRCIELWDRWQPRAFVVDAAGPAGSLVPDLEAAGIVVQRTQMRDMAQACGRMFDAVLNDKLRHRGQAPLTAAVAGAAKRKLGDAWAWSRSSSAVDISPLVAATLALWGATSIPARPVQADPVLAVW